ncbi:MAG: MBL fold metallo-hydrolase, partial [Dehalococcoidia bacterium]
LGEGGFAEMASIAREFNLHLVGSILERHQEGVSKAPGMISRVPAKWIILPLLVAVVLVWTAAITVSDSRLHINVLDVGQGDSILVQKKNQQILIDDGPDSLKLMEQLGDKLPFWDRSIELVVLTHPDADHITGLIEVLERYNVERVLTSGYEADTALYREWRKLIDRKEVERIIACAGQEVVMGENISLEVLLPLQSWENVRFTDPNNNSVVLRLEYGKFSMLLAGDIEAEAEELLLREDVRLRSVILKAPHHGANTSTSPDFLRNVEPLFAAVSAGADNRFGHPAEDVMNRLGDTVGDDRLFVTTEDGTIHFITDGDKLCVETD